jgi:DNA polymerase III epsilon subunit-like protein
MKTLRWPGNLWLVLVILIGFAWAFGALYYDGPSRLFAAANALGMLAVFVFVRPCRRKLGVFGIWFAVVLGWWLTLKPSADGKWQADVAQIPWAEIDGDEVIIHNVRNFDYRTETDFTPSWEIRKVRLSQLAGIDMFINYWGSPWMAHPIVSFRFADSAPVCFSIETRKKEGQSYSAIGGLYRQYNLTYIAADERDVVRVRTNHRKGEDAYLYRTTTSLAQTRARFLEYIHSINQLRDKPRWYNAVATNCTTGIRSQHPAAERMPWDWRLLVNGKADELMYERKTIETGGLPFAELKRRALINSAARAANDAPDFSARIREGRPGM